MWLPLANTSQSEKRKKKCVFTNSTNDENHKISLQLNLQRVDIYRNKQTCPPIENFIWKY